MTTPNTPLKPCPFCGGPAKHRIDHTTEACDYVVCEAGCICMSDLGGQGSCVSAWNTRPQVKVKPLDLSNLLKNAFISGRVSARGSSSFDTEAWVEYDPECCPAYARILSALGEQ